MTALAARTPAGRYRFRHLAHMEFIKLRTLRSTRCVIAVALCFALDLCLA